MNFVIKLLHFLKEVGFWYVHNKEDNEQESVVTSQICAAKLKLKKKKEPSILAVAMNEC